ncbi:polysaccharide deacetylase family protein [Haladaptatus sp. NG-WS-4]
MKRQTRRTFLTTVGATGMAGLAGCSGVISDQKTPDDTGTTSKTSTDGKTSTGGGTTENTNGNAGPTVFEDFEKLGNWHAVQGQGSLKKSTKQTYEGSQSAHVVGSKQTKEGKIFRANFDGNSVDMSGKNLSMAFKCTSHDFVKVAVQLHAPDSGHVVEMKRTLYGPKGKWVRLNLGVTRDQRPKTIDLSKVYEIRILARPMDTNSANPVEFYVDDLKTVPTPNKGYVMLTFDDGLKSHYTKAYKKMKQYGFAGVDAVITDAVYDDGFLTQTQMRKMRSDGWDMIAHPNTQATPMDERSPKEQEQLMKDAKGWLKKYGYQGHKYMAVPKNVLGPKTFELAQKHFDLTLSFGASPNALPAIQKDTILSRMYGTGDVQSTKRMIDHAERYNQLAPFLFHKIGGDGMSEKKFDTILKYIKKKNVEVVTVSDLKEKGLLV